ncbi:Transcriptional regulator ATRX [Acromyrmex echinatior]|uniref:Transcriptional regulator ATRX n=3 Tax=Acromyrmex echinatior TaxID=103372 RepID=F4WPB6_ACREC|nr:Transcriptional regulator ATRX [Acromyrmex echinatior]
MDISSMLEVQVKEETDVKENVTPENDQASSVTSMALAPFSQEESNYHKLIFGNDIASVRFRRIHCTACDIHIGSAPAQAHNMFEHPVLRTLLCSSCRDFYGDGCFEQGDDATDMFCRWCANGGNLYCCSYCSNTFCYKCIRRNFSSLVRKKIEADEKWKCFVCHPSDLYNARAVCWALLQHVQTVKRILSQDKKMSAQEIEEKMNLDESTCCPRRSKRKRRRLESNSEEEDETYSPKVNGIPGHIKRKQLRRFRPMMQNGIVTKGAQFTNRMPIPIRPRPTAFLTGQSFNAESSKSVVGHKNSTVTPSESIVLSSPSVINSNTSLPSRFDPSALQQQSSPLYRTSFMNPSGSTAYIQTPIPVNRIILPQPQPQPQPQLTYQPQQASSYQSSQSLQSSPNTMVSIPNPVDSRPLFILPKPKDLGITLTPNIIELDSDSDDEPIVVEQQIDLTIDTEKDNTDIDKIVPVALTWEKSDDDVRDGVREEQPLKITCATIKKDVSFSEMMLPHNQELDKLLNDAKEKMYNFFDLNNTVENIEIKARQKIVHFYCNMRDTVFQLVHINDRIVRQYIEWRRSQKTEMETETLSPVNENSLESSQENVDIPLDMICVNDSDTESDYENQECQIIEPSDLVKDNNIIKDLLFCKKNVVHRGIGDSSVHLSVDKAIQVYDIVSRDYEKCIGYSMLTKTAYDPKTNDSVLDSPLTSDKNFGKYEEQFIYYLQHIEDNGIETEDSKGLIDLEETPLQELQTDLPFTSHLFQNIDLPVESTDQLKNYRQGINVDVSIVSTNQLKNSLSEENTESSAVSSSQLKNCQQEENIDLSVLSTDQLKNYQQEENNDLSMPAKQLENCQQKKNIDLLIVSVEQLKNCQQKKHLSNNTDSVTEDDKSDTLDKNDEEIVNNSNIKVQEINIEMNDKFQSTELPTIHIDTMNDNVIVSHNEANSNKNDIINIEVAASTENEEDCTIIDD